MSCASLFAQEAAAPFGQVALISQQLGGLHSTLAAQKSLSLVAVLSGHVESGFGHDAAPDFTGTFRLFYKGDRFLYDYEFVGPKGPITTMVESYDGAQYAHLDRRGKTLTVSSRQFMNDIVMCQGHIFFMPYLFLQSGFRGNAFAQLSYTQLTAKKDWMNALASNGSAPDLKEVNRDGRLLWKLSDLGFSVDSVSGEASVFDVYFAREYPWYPMQWERRTPLGNKVSSYVVEELGFTKLENGESIPYPKIAVLRHYKDGKLQDTDRIEVKEISFDSVRDDQFWIDPASADYIRDSNTGSKRVKVAK